MALTQPVSPHLARPRASLTNLLPTVEEKRNVTCLYKEVFYCILQPQPNQKGILAFILCWTMYNSKKVTRRCPVGTSANNKWESWLQRHPYQKSVPSFVFQLRNIGACRAVWVPGQPFVWCAIAESVFCHYTVRYTYICARLCYMLVTMCLHVQSSWYEYAWSEKTRACGAYAEERWATVSGIAKTYGRLHSHVCRVISGGFYHFLVIGICSSIIRKWYWKLTVMLG